MPNRLPLPIRRGINERQAADYFGETIADFRQGVRDGRYPGPRIVGHGRKIWDTDSLDIAYDRISGIGGDNEEQAALDAI